MKKYGPYVAAAVLAVLLGVGGFQAWKYFDVQQRSAASDAFAAALEAAEGDDSAAALGALAEIADPEGAGYELLAAFDQANLMVEAGDTAGALEIWDKIANSGKASEAFKAVATVKWAMHQIGTLEGAAIKARLEPIVAGGTPFRTSALELSALVALNDGDEEEARKFYQQVADDLEAPNEMRGRATRMLAALKE